MIKSIRKLQIQETILIDRILANPDRAEGYAIMLEQVRKELIAATDREIDAKFFRDCGI